MKLPDIAMIVSATKRTDEYVRALVENNLLPNFMLIMQNKSGHILPGQSSENTTKYLDEIIKKENIPFKYIDSTDINSDTVFEAITMRPESVFIYSGYGGSILRNRILNAGKKFLHIHGGFLPDYKGSTTNYYSLINENSCGASSIFLDEQIDGGPILLRKHFPPPEDRSRIDYNYDSMIRAKVLVETLQMYIKNGRWKFEIAENTEGETYYIIHPLLKHIAILSRS